MCLIVIPKIIIQEQHIYLIAIDKNIELSFYMADAGDSIGYSKHFESAIHTLKISF